MKKNKIISIFLVLSIIFIPIISLADDTSKNKNEPIINARHAVIIDRSSSKILYGKSENEKCKMASTTKIMTATIVLEKSQNLNEIVTISKKAAETGGSRVGLSTNDQITVENLLYSLMMVSGNDAAVALAEYIAGNTLDFSELMNQKAKELGLTSTHFTSPHGLDSDEHYTTAYELAILSNYALKNETFAKIVNTKSYTIQINNNAKTLNNTNELLGYTNGIYGIKTGFTNGANRCLVTSCKRDNLDIICVVLGCDTKKDRGNDSIELINYIYENFTVINIKEKLNESFNKWYQIQKNLIIINKGKSSNLHLYIDELQIPYETIAINKDLTKKLNITYNVSNELTAPIYENSIIGQINVSIENDKLFNVDILSQNTIYKKNIYQYIKQILKNYFIYVKSSFKY